MLERPMLRTHIRTHVSTRTTGVQSKEGARADPPTSHCTYSTAYSHHRVLSACEIADSAAWSKAAPGPACLGYYGFALPSPMEANASGSMMPCG